MMEDFIIRIYRSEKDNPRNFVGLVEMVGKKGRSGFTTMDELWDIFNSSIGDEPGGRGGFKRKGRRSFDRVT